MSDLIVETCICSQHLVCCMCVCVCVLWGVGVLREWWL